MLFQKYPTLDAIWIAAALLTIEECRKNPNASKEDLFFEPIEILKKADRFVDGRMDLYAIQCLATAKQEHCSRNYLQSDSNCRPSCRRLSRSDEFTEKCFPKYLNSDNYKNDLFQIDHHEYTLEDIFQFVKNEFPKYLERGTQYIDEGFSPKKTEYHPGITKEQWIELLQDSSVIFPENYEMLLQYYKVGGAATIEKIAKTFNTEQLSYNMLGSNIGRKVHSKINCPVPDGNKYHVIPFLRKEGKKLVLKLRPELREAIAEIERLKLEKEYDNLAERNLDRNILLYGPSKSGKKFLAIKYAVAICENKSITELKQDSNQTIFDMFQILVSKKKITKIFSKELCRLDLNNIEKIFGEKVKPKVIFLEDSDELDKCGNLESSISYIEAVSTNCNCTVIGTLDSEKYPFADTNLKLTSIFNFIEVKPNADTLRAKGIGQIYDLNVAKMLEIINQRIEYLVDWKYTIGHEYFLKINVSPSLTTLQKIFESTVFPLLCLNLKYDYQKIQLILGDNAKSDDSYKFIIDEEVFAKDVFKGDVNQITGTTKKRFAINRLAFSNLESYKEIM